MYSTCEFMFGDGEDQKPLTVCTDSETGLRFVPTTHLRKYVHQLAGVSNDGDLKFPPNAIRGLHQPEDEDFIVHGGGRTKKHAVLRLNMAVDKMVELFEGRSVPGCVGKDKNHCLCVLLQQLKAVAVPDPGNADGRPALPTPTDLCRVCQATLMLRPRPVAAEGHVSAGKAGRQEHASKKADAAVPTK
jgi:hypothetical protein